MIAGGILLGVWGGFKRRILTTLAGIIGVGVAVLALGMAPPAPVLAVLGAMLALGLFVPLANGPIQAILQMTVSPELQGRVFTLMGSLAGAMVPVGLALAAPIADLLGVRAWYLVAGLVCIAMGTSGFFVRSILYIEDEASPSAEVAGVGDVAAAS